MEINETLRKRESTAVKANVRQRKDLNWKHSFKLPILPQTWN